jgi:hypothetical protein
VFSLLQELVRAELLAIAVSRCDHGRVGRQQVCQSLLRVDRQSVVQSFPLLRLVFGVVGEGGVLAQCAQVQTVAEGGVSADVVEGKIVEANVLAAATKTRTTTRHESQPQVISSSKVRAALIGEENGGGI